jgi:tetratricopeptide (TPR) repeat protein
LPPLYRTAIRLDPKYAGPHNNLGVLLKDQQKLAEAEREYRTAIRLDPEFVHPHNNLGGLLYAQQKLAEAEHEFRQVIRLDPKFVRGQGALGLVPLEQGRFEEARRATQRFLDLIPSDEHALRESGTRQLRRCNELIRLDRKLPAVLAGKKEPVDNNERRELAWLCRQPYQRRYAASARLWQEAFHIQPCLAANLQSGNRYNAACAALAGRGQGKDAGKLGAKERAGWRAQARQSLEADLTLWKRLAGGSDPQPRLTAAAPLHYWQHDGDLAGVRDSTALATLPAAEHDAWCRLWAKVAAVRIAAQTAP